VFDGVDETVLLGVVLIVFDGVLETVLLGVELGV
jgi:hypothetical protein